MKPTNEELFDIYYEARNKEYGKLTMKDKVLVKIDGNSSYVLKRK